MLQALNRAMSAAYDARSNRRVRCLPMLACVCALAASAPAVAQGALGAAFTYQGQLTESGQPANGLYDLQVCLFDAPGNPVALMCAPDFNDVPVEQGVFVLALDFGAAPFSGQQRFLELRVRPGASGGAYTILAPRQLVRAMPEALRAASASAAPWAGLSGVPAGFADGVDDNSGGTVTSVTTGTGLSGGAITSSGTISIANGGVGSAQLAAGAVGVAQINTAQVQARIAAACPEGEYLRGINPDGSVDCDSVVAYLGIKLFTIVDEPSAGDVGQWPRIAIGTDGRPVISYLDGAASDLKVAKCANAMCTGESTLTTVDAAASAGGASGTSIAVAADGLPVISYTAALNLRVAKCANSACTGSATITTVDPANVVGQYSSIAIGPDGRPVISYWDATAGALKVAKCANAACTGTATITTVDDPANTVGEYSSLAIGGDGFPVISYRDATAGALKVAKCANAACTGAAAITTVDDPANNVGEYTSLAIGADGRPVISYFDRTASALKVAKCANAACSGTATITTVEDYPAVPPVIVGTYTSIAISADGLPIIAYSHGGLEPVTTHGAKVAKCTTVACTGTATITFLTRDVGGKELGIAIGSDGLPVISYYTVGQLGVVKCGTGSCR
jgi:hypothetical protein